MSAEVKQVGTALLAIDRHRVTVGGSTRGTWTWTVYRVEADRMPETIGTFTTLAEARASIEQVTG